MHVRMDQFRDFTSGLAEQILQKTQGQGNASAAVIFMQQYRVGDLSGVNQALKRMQEFRHLSYNNFSNASTVAGKSIRARARSLNIPSCTKRSNWAR